MIFLKLVRFTNIISIFLNRQNDEREAFLVFILLKLKFTYISLVFGKLYELGRRFWISFHKPLRLVCWSFFLPFPPHKTGVTD